MGLANTIFDYVEIFHNRQRRHSAMGYRTPIDDLSFTNDTLTAVSQPPRLEPKRWVRSNCPNRPADPIMAQSPHARYAARRRPP